MFSLRYLVTGNTKYLHRRVWYECECIYTDGSGRFDIWVKARNDDEARRRATARLESQWHSTARVLTVKERKVA